MQPSSLWLPFVTNEGQEERFKRRSFNAKRAKQAQSPQCEKFQHFAFIALPLREPGGKKAGFKNKPNPMSGARGVKEEEREPLSPVPGKGLQNRVLTLPCFMNRTVDCFPWQS